MTEPTPTVYSYYSPEVANTVNVALRYLNGGADSIHKLLKQNVAPGLDDLHLPLMERYERFARSEGVIGLESFPKKYFTGGSSEGIFHLLNEARMVGDPVYQFEGEYQGYGQYADALGMEIGTVESLAELALCESGTVILSNPASKDGNIVPPNVLTTIMHKHHVILDLAYMGMTQRPLNIDLTQPGILGVVGSLSKPFGMYYYRIGFAYSRSAIDSLYGNKWFKNALSIKLGEAILDRFADPAKMDAFKNMWFGLQVQAVEAVRKYVGNSMCPVKPSDVWLLAYNDEAKLGAKFNSFKRTEENYRFCLTPYYQEVE